MAMLVRAAGKCSSSDGICSVSRSRLLVPVPGSAAVMVLVSLAVALAARPAVLLLPQLPQTMNADERLALLRFLADVAAATGINAIALQTGMSDEETQACETVSKERPESQLPRADARSHTVHEVIALMLLPTSVLQQGAAGVGNHDDVVGDQQL